MKPFIIIVQIAVIFWCQFGAARSQNNRLWVEVGKELFVIEPEGLYTWKEAVAECIKQQSNLIHPKGDYDYAKLKAVIKHNFQNYSSFWTNTQVKRTNIFHHIGLGKEEYNRQKCNKFDNSSMFKFLPDNCDKRLGFICEKPLLNTYSSFNTQQMVYFVHPNQEFTCEEAYDECEKRHMTLVVLKDRFNNKQLADYVFINYGSSVNFWFGYNNETHYNCATPTRGQQLKYNSKLGFICQQARFESRAMSMRHIILLIFVSIAAFLAIVVFIVIKCFCLKKEEDCHLPERDFTEEVKVTDIK